MSEDLQIELIMKEDGSGVKQVLINGKEQQGITRLLVTLEVNAMGVPAVRLDMSSLSLFTSLQVKNMPAKVTIRRDNSLQVDEALVHEAAYPSH